MLDWSKYANFTENEFRCKCGCGRADMEEHFMGFLQRIRDVVGFPIRVNSGFRCPEYNAGLSSTGLNGPHTFGLAVDLGLYGPRVHAVTTEALKLNFTGVGLKQYGLIASRFVHLDLIKPGGVHPRPWIWTYEGEK